MDDWLSHVLAIHFHPVEGSPYWLDRQRALGFDVRLEVRTLEDLHRMGPMPEEDLRCRPLEDFIPRRFARKQTGIVVGETGGTAGPPKYTVYRGREFHRAFIDPFVAVAEARGFPRGAEWLYLGPSGPHLIGKAAIWMARRMGSREPFYIDFDPRWVKRLIPGSVGWERYFQHLEEQALSILTTQQIGVLFSTPPILERLASKMGKEERERIRGIHLGGLPLNGELYRRFREELFPQAVIIPGYGNTLFGACMEVEFSRSYSLDYHPQGTRLVLEVVSPGGRPDPTRPSPERLPKRVGYGERGQVVFHRLDEGFLILNMFERDWATRIPPPRNGKRLGFLGDGVRDPCPLHQEKRPLAQGLY